MARIGKVNETYRYWFNIRLGTGAPATGVAGGDITVTVRNPADSAESNPTPSESATTGGLYYFDIPAAFTNTNGVGRYGVTIDVDSASPSVRDTGGDPVTFYDVDFDDLSVPGDAMDLTTTAVDDIWDEDIVAAHGTSDTSGLLLRALGALISQRSNNPTLNALLGVADSAGVDLPEQIDTELTGTHGAGSWQTSTLSAGAVSTAVWSEPLPGAFGAGTAGNIVGNNLDAAVSTRATQAQILSDATPFPGANIDATISSRAVAGDAMALTTGAVDDIWDEDIVAAHGTGDTAGLLLRALGATISQRSNNPTLDALLGVGDVAGRDLPEQVDIELTATHGAGSWQSATVSPSAVATAVWSEALPGVFGAGTAGNIVGNNLDAAVSTRATQAQILSDATPFAGANIDAAISTRATQAQILSDATPFPGSNIDAAISTRSTPAQITAAQTAIINEMTRLTVAVETTAAAGSSTTEIRTPLTEADDFYNNMQVFVINSAGVAARNVNDYAQTNGAFTVDALPFTPTVADPVIVLARTGSVPIDTASISSAVWSESLPGAFGAGTAGNILGNNLDASISSIASAIAALNDLDISDVQTALTNQGYTSARASNLDNLDVAISTIQSAIAALNDLSIVDVQTALTNQGYTVARAALLDNLDATISSVNTAIAALNDLSIADVQTALTNQGYTSVRAALLDNLDTAISTLATDLTLVLGLVQHNFMLEQTVYNAAGLLTSAKMRLFTNKTDVDNATDGGSGEGEFATYQITVVAEVSPQEELPKTYKVAKLP